MSKPLLHWLLPLIIGGLCMAQPAVAAQPGTGNLVSVAWLAKNLQRDDVLLLDASPPPMHSAGHIPGAHNIDVYSFGGREVSADEMERRIQSWGVSPGKTVVIYDQGGSFLATSLFFDLYYHGFPAHNLLVLDGGLAKWQATGGTVTQDRSPAHKPGSFRVNQLREEVRVRLPEFLVASGDPAHNALVEALEPSHHFGGARFFDRAGHVPNAIMLPAADFYNADKTFKSAQEIGRMLAYLGIRPEQQIHTHCGGGIAASVPFFSMKFMLDYPRVKLYKESQLEWLRDDRGLPFWTYDAPTLTREKSWLSGWGSQMMRNFGVARLSVVDVRSADAFALSHVPYALHVPSELFRRHLSEPAKLAEALEAAGVDPEHEAVIMSDGGLNASSALAFLMLERLGQKRVSILMDSVADWGFGGYSLTREPTLVGPKRAPQDLAVPASAYPARVRPGTLLAAPPPSPGLYPKVYLASGKAVPAASPARGQEGRTIHVPFTDLLNPDGTPKAAKDIWSILAKAGLPRYAEIICYADDPGEAAANYFLLKLMGYPDVKVLV